jgi:TusA-related sulfurtransferase
VAIYVIDFEEKGESCVDAPMIRLLAALDQAEPGDVIEARIYEERDLQAVRRVCQAKGLRFEEAREGPRAIVRIHKD